MMFVNAWRLKQANVLSEAEVKHLGLEVNPFTANTLQTWLMNADEGDGDTVSDRFAELEVEWSRVKLGATLGAGACGQVFKAEYGGQHVAVKRTFATMLGGS